jgi:hypothetical protein
MDTTKGITRRTLAQLIGGAAGLAAIGIRGRAEADVPHRISRKLTGTGYTPTGFADSLLYDRLITGDYIVSTDDKGNKRPVWDGKGLLRLTGLQESGTQNWGKQFYLIQVDDDKVIAVGDREPVPGWEPASLVSALKTYDRPHDNDHPDAIQVGVTRQTELTDIVKSTGDRNYLKFRFAGPTDGNGNPLYWWDNVAQDRVKIPTAEDIGLSSVPTKNPYSPSLVFDAEWIYRTVFVELGDHGALGIRPWQVDIRDIGQDPDSTRNLYFFAYKIEPDQQGRNGLGPAKLGLIAHLIINGDQGLLTAEMGGINDKRKDLIQKGFNPDDFLTTDYAKISFGGYGKDGMPTRLYGVDNQGASSSVLNLSSKIDDPTSLLPIALGYNPKLRGRAQWVR